MAAGTVYGLEAELSDLEECARGVSAATSENELAFLEDQVASAAAQVQQSELQVGYDIDRAASLENSFLQCLFSIARVTQNLRNIFHYLNISSCYYYTYFATLLLFFNSCL